MSDDVDISDDSVEWCDTVVRSVSWSLVTDHHSTSILSSPAPSSSDTTIDTSPPSSPEKKSLKENLYFLTLPTVVGKFHELS